MKNISEPIVHYHLDFYDHSEKKLDLIAKHTKFDSIRYFEDSYRFDFSTFIDIIIHNKNSSNKMECDVRLYKKEDMYNKNREEYTHNINKIVFMAIISPEYINFAAENIYEKIVQLKDSYKEKPYTKDDITNIFCIVTKIN